MLHTFLSRRTCSGCLLRLRLLLLQLEHNDPGTARQATGLGCRLLLDSPCLIRETYSLTLSRSLQLRAAVDREVLKRAGTVADTSTLQTLQS